MTWLLSLIGSKRIGFPVLLGLIVLGLVIGAYFKGRSSGYSQAIQDTNAEKVQAINENLRIKEKSDNIMRPDDIVYGQRLLDKTI